MPVRVRSTPLREALEFAVRAAGRNTTLLAQAAELAIREKAESISPGLLERAAAAGIFQFPAEQERNEADA